MKVIRLSALCLIPDGVIGISQYNNPSGRTMALGSTQSLTEMSTRNISWGAKGGRCLGLTPLPHSCTVCQKF
jgi:phosphoribosylformylglycinamidine (FGAM) synthase-like enzyme